ncbi:MAG: ammonium transporter [Actinobacteria bacterium]|nr:ammonium transporter [Actinomycetota bacterium]MSW90402.1 ammonium transporter [Actinomycetota bacterium]MSX87314.1 ammonium transporter [Actinomycetota bacterium]MSY70528.1 ammonium transporter [Actinomycetota bacterium]
MWVVIGAALVIFMQAGFALVETGLTQKKNAAHVMSTNFAIFGLGFVGFLFIGFPLAFGGFTYSAFGLDAPMNAEPLLGSGSWIFLWSGWDHLGDGASAALLGFFLYMVAFMDTVATIPTGSMAERWKWKSFVIWGLFCGAIYYPLFAAWTWGGGWLAKSWDSMSLGAGYADFAGSGVVHAVGGAAALAGALILGPRYGKISPDGKVRAIPGHNIPMAQLGCFILLFGWFGFNAASTFAVTDVQFATAATNTGIAAAIGAVVAMYYMTFRTGKPDPTMMINGMLAGLVAITAPCAFVGPWAAAVIGALASVIVIEAALFIDRKGIDDPVGAIAVHGIGGTFGALCVGIFANGKYGAGWNGSPSEGVEGILYGDAGQFGAQLLGVVVIWTVIFGIAYGFFFLQNKFTKGGIRSSLQDEIEGLDMREMGVAAYID